MALNKITYDDKSNYQTSSLANIYKVTADNMNEIKTVVNSIIDVLYPVDSIYISVSPTNPGTLFGGTWEAFGTGRTLVGVDTSQTEFNSVEKTGGEKTHTLTTNEIPGYAMTFSPTNEGNFHIDYVGTNGNVRADQIGGQAMSLLQPYITVYMWKRTA